jgi:hypothetical protein
MIIYSHALGSRYSPAEEGIIASTLISTLNRYYNASLSENIVIESFEPIAQALTRPEYIFEEGLPKYILYIHRPIDDANKLLVGNLMDPVYAWNPNFYFIISDADLVMIKLIWS